MKTTALFLLILTGCAAWGQTPPTPAGGNTATNDNDLVKLLRQTDHGATNPAAWTPVPPPSHPGNPAAVAPAAASVPEAFTNTTTTVVPSVVQTTTVTPNPAQTLQPRLNPRRVPRNVPSVPGTPVTPGMPPASPVQSGLPQSPAPAPTTMMTAPSPQPAAPPEQMIKAGEINFPAAELNKVLDIYAELVNRTILRAPNLPNPTITLKTQTALTKTEAIEALDAVFALNGIAMVNIGDKFVKAVPTAQAGTAGAATDTRDAADLPDLGQYVTHVVQLKYTKPSEIVPVLQSFGNAKDIMAVDSSGIVIIRDYAENVKRMLEMIDQIDVTVQSDIQTEVIPIKYALASDIASALSSLGGSGSTTTSVGHQSSSGIGGTAAAGGYGGTQNGLMGNNNRLGSTPQLNTPGGAGAAGAPSSSASFSDRLRSIINRAASSGEMQLLGQTKIIADERTNSLLVFATRQDMEIIKGIIAKLDVVLAQVLIESLIMEVSLDKTQSLGVSYLQYPQTSGNVTGVGAINNVGLLNSASFTAASGAATNAVSSVASGFSYLAHWNNDLDITATAIAGNDRVNVLSRPTIQTSHAVAANLFVGSTVPYITGTTFGSFSGASSSSTYEEMQVGITLNVLPLINPDGLVVMDIQEDIEQLGTPTTIDGNPVPTTTKRSASAKIAVRDRETIILGGFISNTKSTTISGVPLLKDIPVLGYLFRSTGDSNQRTELIVLMRPTVLPTPEAAAALVPHEQNKLPGVRRAFADEKKFEEREIKKANKDLGGEETLPLDSTNAPTSPY